MSSKPIFAEKEDCKKNWHEIPADFSIKVFLHAKLGQKQKTVSLKILKIQWNPQDLYLKEYRFCKEHIAIQKKTALKTMIFRTFSWKSGCHCLIPQVGDNDKLQIAGKPVMER